MSELIITNRRAQVKHNFAQILIIKYKKSNRSPRGVSGGGFTPPEHRNSAEISYIIKGVDKWRLT